MIDINKLPVDVRTIIELKEATDQTFQNFLDNDMTDWFWGLLRERSDPNVEHSVLISTYGSQGCHLEGTIIQAKRGLVAIQDIVAGDEVWAGGDWRKCTLVKSGIQSTMRITLCCGVVLNLTPDHRMKVGDRWKRADELKKGEFFVPGDAPGFHQLSLQECEIVGISQGLVGNVYDLHVDEVHEYIANGVVSHNSGKSYAALAIACYLDPTFNVDRIYFGYQRLVDERSKLQQNTAVIVDEQAQPFGIDSHRINIMLTGLKEQLRKKSIHFIFCSPVLYPEHETSMYLLETMFIDYETEECYAALKTRDGLCMGHVRIPSPLKILEHGDSLATKQFIKDYQAKKDAHLEVLLGQKDVDVFEERATAVCKHEMFLRVEKMYVDKVGYIPHGMLIQLINKIFPEFNAGVMPAEIAARIKFNKETDGSWSISGAKKKDPDDAVVKRSKRK
jgi:hypothetical protein